VGPRGSHFLYRTAAEGQWAEKKEKTAMFHFWDTHHMVLFQKKMSSSGLECNFYAACHWSLRPCMHDEGRERDSAPISL